VLDLAPGAVLQSPELGNYRPIRALPAAAPLPDDIAKLLGWSKQAPTIPGAYQAAATK
jgi:hypothetical protein